MGDIIRVLPGETFPADGGFPLQIVPVGRHDRIHLRGEAGAVWADARDGIPSEFLFRAGGDDSVRGYAYQSLGPVDAAGVAVGGTGLLGHANAQTQARTGQLTSRRKLGQLEVSSIGLGVQNMARTYQTTIPADDANKFDVILAYKMNGELNDNPALLSWAQAMIDMAYGQPVPPTQEARAQQVEEFRTLWNDRCLGLQSK